MLETGKPLVEKYHDHELDGEYKGSRECHIRPDWLLIYWKGKEYIELQRTDTHSDLFQELYLLIRADEDVVGWNEQKCSEYFIYNTVTGVCEKTRRATVLKVCVEQLKNRKIMEEKESQEQIQAPEYDKKRMGSGVHKAIWNRADFLLIVDTHACGLYRHISLLSS